MAIGVSYDGGNGAETFSSADGTDISGRIGKKPTRGMVSPWGDVGRIGKKPVRGMVSQWDQPARPKLAQALGNLGRDSKIDLDRIDPRNMGRAIGSSKPHGKEPDDSKRNSNEHTPWENCFVSAVRAEEEKEMEDNPPVGEEPKVKNRWLTLWAFIRRDRKTGEGRSFETTGEERVPLGKFKLGGEGGGETPTGYTGYVSRLVRVEYDMSDYKFKYVTVEDEYEGGLLKTKGTEETKHDICGTTPLTGE